jgi:processive 1,2-diacylglycerol beta-glucosyltransferase
MARLLIVSARMGAGHDGAANELARRARSRGHSAEVVDFLEAFPWPLGAVWERFYWAQLRHWPESYEKSYQQFYRHPALWSPFVRLERALAGRRCLRWIRDAQPDVIVSTYSFATLVIGRLREEGRITVPTVAYLTDLGVHPRTVHPAIDLHLAVHPTAAEDARRYVGGRVDAPGPAVSPAFDANLVPRDVARKELGIAQNSRVVLVVCGSWGIGANLSKVVASLTADPRLTVVVACGRDHALKARLEMDPRCTAVGWTDAMPRYMAAADVVVENAGGLSSLEAFASGVPVISYDPIPGHGRDNVRAMVRAGITTAPTTLDELALAISTLTEDTSQRRAQLAAVKAMFDRDPIDSIIEMTVANRSQ